jgi:hypothetical protein
MSRDYLEMAYYLLGRRDEFSAYTRACAAAIVLDTRGIEVSEAALHAFVDGLPEGHAEEITTFWNGASGGRRGGVRVRAHVLRMHATAIESPLVSGTS